MPRNREEARCRVWPFLRLCALCMLWMHVAINQAKIPNENREILALTLSGMLYEVFLDVSDSYEISSILRVFR